MQSIETPILNSIQSEYGWSNMRSVQGKHKLLIDFTRVCEYFCLSILLGCVGTGEGHEKRGRPVSVFVSQVLDGDSIRAKRPIRWVVDGEPKRITRIRYIGVDTPEHNDPFWRAARALNKSLVYRKRVRLEFDKEKTDRYNRLLAYVYVDDLFINAEVVKRGYARAYTVEPNTRYERLFKQLEDEARADGRGMWSTLADILPAVIEQEESPSSNMGKYIASKNSKVFHLSSCKWAKRILEINKVHFATYQEVINSGRRPCRICKPNEEVE